MLICSHVSPDMLTRWQNTLLVGDGVSLEPPDKAKTKGRTIPASEVREVQLGAKGVKKNNKTCYTCGIACGHDSRTCHLIPRNKERLDALRAPKRRGRPPGAKNKQKSPAMVDDAHPGETKKGTMGPRRRGRPPGAKNKVRAISIVPDEGEDDGEEDGPAPPTRRRLVHLRDLDEE